MCRFVNTNDETMRCIWRNLTKLFNLTALCGVEVEHRAILFVVLRMYAYVCQILIKISIWFTKTSSSPCRAAGNVGNLVACTDRLLSKRSIFRASQLKHFQFLVNYFNHRTRASCFDDKSLFSSGNALCVRTLLKVKCIFISYPVWMSQFFLVTSSAIEICVYGTEIYF